MKHFIMKIQVTRWLTTGLFALTLLWSQLAQAYVPIRSPSGAIVRWSQQPVYWFYNHNGFNQIDANTVLSVFQTSFKKWEAPSCSGIRFKFGGNTTNKWNAQDSRNVLIWNGTIPDPKFPTALALTLPRYSNNGVYLDADIIFNGGSYQWSIQPSGQIFDIHGTATHEIGHFLGLGHTNVTDATMFPTARPGLCPCRTLKQDDISGVCALYPNSGQGTKRQLGQPCDQGNKCDANLICLVYQQGDTSGVCHRTCPNGVCLSGDKCFDLGNSETACGCQTDSECSGGKSCKDHFCTGGTQTHPTQKLGEICDPTKLCVTNLTCVQVQTGSTTGICLPTCPNGTCAGGEKCYTLSNKETACACQNNGECTGGKTCTNYQCTSGTNTGGKEGEACSTQGLCQAGLKCVNDPSSGKSLCVRPCTKNEDCNNGYQCNNQFSVCMPPQQGTREKGQSCDPKQTCQADLQCTVVETGAQTGICLPICQGTCSGGEKCVPLSGGINVCVCLQNRECPTGKQCQKNSCIAAPGCTQDSECGVGRQCLGGTCTNQTSSGCKSNADCSLGTVCQNGKCSTLPPPKTNCTPACGEGFSCVGGSCIYNNECKSNNDCGANEKCQGNHCVPATIPQPDKKQPDLSSPKEGCKGCHSHSGNEQSMLFFWFLFFGFVGLEIKRRKMR